MDNKFYKPFDYKFLKKKEPCDLRTPFERDRDRIIHSFPFRRLQNKTQVFMSGEYDFYRTRLTHSIEVAQIGRSICNYLNRTSHLLSEREFCLDPSLVEAICLAHDLGHPPFGHASESKLNDLMCPYGGFEGNAQTLRIITSIFYSHHDKGRYGMNPTRAFLDGLLKYKVLYSQRGNLKNHFLYDDQQRFLKFAFNNHEIPSDLSPSNKINKFRSIECQIMDWADDTAYSLTDFGDAIRAEFVTSDKIQKWIEEKKSKQKTTQEDESVLEKIIAMIDEKDVGVKINRKIGKFIEVCSLEETKNFMSDYSNRYCFKLVINTDVRHECEVYKNLANDLVFKSPEICQLEYKSSFMIEKIFEVLNENYIAKRAPEKVLLPRDIHDYIISKNNKNTRARIICDYIAGMTDQFATRTYKRLFDPDFGSIVDFV